MSAATYEWQARRRRELRLPVVISLVIHAGMAALLIATPSFRPRAVIGPSVVTVELVAAPPAPARRAPPPPPARPSPRKVLLPARPTRTVPPPPIAKPEPEPAPKPAEAEYEDLLEKLRAEAGEERPDPVELARRQAKPPPPTPEVVPRAAAVPTGATPGATGRLAPPEVVAWVRDARIHVRRSWVLAAGFRLQDLETHVVVDLDSGGRLREEPRVTRRSGNPWYDESVVRAIRKADPLPAPPEAGEWPFVFRPEDR